MKCAISSGWLALAAGDCAASAKRRPGEQEVKQEVITCLWLNNLLAGVSKGTGFTPKSCETALTRSETTSKADGETSRGVCALPDVG